MKIKIIFCLACLIPVFSLSVLCNSAPVVSNVAAGRQADNSKLVDIYCDLGDVSVVKLV